MQSHKQITLGLLLAAASSTNMVRAAEVSIPFPNFMPRPSAITLYCRGLMSQTLTAHDASQQEGKLVSANISMSLFTADKGGNFNGVNFDTKIAFDGARLLVALKVSRGASQAPEYGPFWPYKVLNDAPGNYVAVMDRTAAVGSLQIISMNRETGTMMLTNTYASLPDRGHPYTSSQFYACKDTDWR